MGLESIVAVTLVAVGAFASWMQGKKSGVTDALSQASDIVGMLSTQVGELRTQLGIRELEIERLKHDRDLAGYCPACQRQGSGESADATAHPPMPPNGADGP